MSNKVAVLGSINVDTTYHVHRFPEPGETLAATDKSSAPGGKGANQAMTKDVLSKSEEVMKKVDFLITQFETPQTVALEAFKMAKANGVITVLNPAPATEILPELLEYTDIIAPNETESALLTGIEITDDASLDQTAEYFRAKGVGVTLVTLGSKGAYYSTKDGSGTVPAFKVKAIDTTAAGDTFIGALISQLLPDFSNLADAITYAQRASSLTVQGMGAMPSIPTFDQVQEALK